MCADFLLGGLPRLIYAKFGYFSHISILRRVKFIAADHDKLTPTKASLNPIPELKHSLA